MCHHMALEFVDGFSKNELEECVALFDEIWSLEEWEKKVNQWLGAWGWSHLAVYRPQEHAEIWESTTKTTGIKPKFIEGEYVVYKAHPDSDFKRGDLILSVNGNLELTHEKILYTSGTYRVERGDKLIDLQVQVKDHFWDERMVFNENKLEVPSFRGEFFQEETLKELAKRLQLQKPKELVVDLRDNLGGNITAGLKFLSLFFCEPVQVGTFEAPSRMGKRDGLYPNTLDQTEQIKIVKALHKVKLQTFSNSSCYSGSLKVLINSMTSSTAELVAQALKELRRANLIGEVSSGRMVLAGWEPVNFFPDGYFFSFPYATYQSAKGDALEGTGVVPHLFRSYKLEKEKQSIDSFLSIN